MRKTRLLVCAYCRHIWNDITDPHRDTAIDVAERYVDGEADERELWPMFETIQAAAIASERQDRCEYSHNRFVLSTVDPTLSIKEVLHHLKNIVVLRSGYRRANRSPVQQSERNAQAKLIRDIFGNPFRPVTFDPSWRTDTVLSLTRQMYDCRDFSAMPILADALQDAGCNNEDILNHCRDSKQTHVRGCWVVDLVLEKE